mgnify:CR=1 FL=1
MNTPVPVPAPAMRPRWLRVAEAMMAAALGVMAAAVFLNVVLRYVFGTGIAASEELSRLLFVWMVFLGAAVAYPFGEHMAFTALLRPLQRRSPALLSVATRLIHALVTFGCGLVAWGSWQQVVVGLDSTSVVMGYPMALLPLPALLASVAIGVMSAINTVRNRPIDFGHDADIE